MAPNEYSSVGSGKLKLKGVKDSKVDKKKKKKAPSSSQPKEGGEAVVGEAIADGFNDRSVMLKKLEEEDEAMANEEGRSLQKQRGERPADSEAGRREEERGGVMKTEAERRYEEQRRKRLEERLKREGVKTHKERVEELNKYLSSLSEHHDMPRIGPG
ncbi:hypothetical protein CLCR_04368 [Cladophialophora carrionii]|uniref:DUF1754-domain-containing protein n=1 Tax=Cladophialophora carrionii TaxID=86049 RepID=A0A1C1CHR0_9EURO|nr:hypothetical protein CLCR_04368 [Cladophialophora carrionii]